MICLKRTDGGTAFHIRMNMEILEMYGFRIPKIETVGGASFSPVMDADKSRHMESGGGECKWK